MSTILDSLKKSSDQRDGNDKTSIDNFNFGNDKKSSSKGFIVIVVIFAITSAILYFGYDYIFTDEGNLVAQETAIESTIKSKQNNLESPENLTENSAETDNPQNKKQKPDNKRVRQELKNIQANKQDKKEAARKDKPKDEPKAENRKTKQTLSEVVSNIAESNKNQDTDTKPAIKLSKPGELSQTQTTKQVKAQKYPYVYQLPFSVRKDIPKFTLNIHVYDENPENRIVIINGVKFIIGDLIEEEVLVKDILQDGALLEFNGQVFLVPKL